MEISTGKLYFLNVAHTGFKLFNVVNILGAASYCGRGSEFSWTIYEFFKDVALVDGKLSDLDIFKILMQKSNIMFRCSTYVPCNINAKIPKN